MDAIKHNIIDFPGTYTAKKLSFEKKNICQPPLESNLATPEWNFYFFFIITTIIENKDDFSFHTREKTHSK